MKSALVLRCCLCLIFLFASFCSYTQNDVSLKIKSEQKQLYKENEAFKEIVDDIYTEKKENLKRGIADWLRQQVKNYMKQTMHNDEVKLAYDTRIELVQMDQRIFLRYYLPANSVKFRVTTASKPSYEDPYCSFLFDVMGDFELKQSGTAESIKLSNPTWKIVQTYNSGYNFDNFALSKEYFMGMLERMLTEFQPIYASLNNVNEKLNDHIQRSISSNNELQKEFEIDENKELKAVADVANASLVFQHSYSQKGISKRTATTNANTLKEGPKSTTTSVPVSTSASELGKKSNVSNIKAGNKPVIKKN